MRESIKTLLVALLLASLSCVAGAAGLGRLNVLSAIGQPLVAEIELVSVSKEELGSLSARIASPDAFRAANLQYNPSLASARLTLERRPNGQHYLKLTSSRMVSEPFIDLLVELTWASGRLSREYTALLDPPGVTPAPAPAPVIAAVPESRPAPEPQPKVAAAAPAPVRPVAPAAPSAGSKEYGPIERGETLGKIAKSVMPEGVTLEQMLAALYRNNPDAFIQKNLNLVRTGKILRVPDREDVVSIARGEAVKEYRTHVADWNTYRQKVAGTAATVPAGRTAVSGKISAKVDDKTTGGAPKDVVRLSKGEAPGDAAGKGKQRSSADRIRMLEEEAIAREKALNEANERINQLEKTIQGMKKLVELKSPGMAAAQQQAQQATAPKPDAKAAAKAEPVKPEPVKPEAKKPEAVAVAKPEPAKPAEAPKPTAARPEPAKPEATPPVAATVKPEEKKPEQVAVPAPRKDEVAAKPKPKPAPAPKEPELMDQIMEAATDPLYLGAGGGALVIGGLAFWMARRRRAQAEDDDDGPPVAPRLGKAAATAAGAAAMNADTTAASGSAAAQASAPAEDVDPLAEAEVYIAYGRDGQAEEILKEALAKNPRRQEVLLKLLEVYSARKDKSAFGKLAGDLNKLTGGSGGNWTKAAAMGYALDPANSLYMAGKDVTAAIPTRPPFGTSTDIDLDLGMGSAGSTPDILLDPTTHTGMVELGAAKTGAPTTAMPDFTLEVPAAGGGQVEAAPAALPPVTNMLDFQIDLPRASEDPATTANPPAAAASGDAGIDFKLDAFNLSLEGEPKTTTSVEGGEKDGHWYDVQTKFDLAKAYQEMGDKDGAKEILQEVVKEGDAEQQAQAKTLMDSLG